MASGVPGQGVLGGGVQGLRSQERRKGELFYSHFLRLVPNWVPREAVSGGSRALPGCGSQGNGMELFWL